MGIVNPREQRSVPFDQVSKRQLARTVNEQSRRILQLDEQIKAMSQIMIAVALNPEAFQPAVNGRIFVSKAALERVKGGARVIVQRQSDGGVAFWGEEPKPTLIEAPPTVSGITN